MPHSLGAYQLLQKAKEFVDLHTDTDSINTSCSENSNKSGNDNDDDNGRNHSIETIIREIEESANHQSLNPDFDHLMSAIRTINLPEHAFNYLGKT